MKTMPGYYAYLIGVDGHIANRVGFVCDDDEEAKGLAKQMVAGHAIELWHEESSQGWNWPAENWMLIAPSTSSVNREGALPLGWK